MIGGRPDDAVTQMILRAMWQAGIPSGATPEARQAAIGDFGAPQGPITRGEQLAALAQVMGNAIPMRGGFGQVPAARNTQRVTGEGQYLYHATNEENARSIMQQGLKPHKPHEFTDQRVWPDGGVDRRSYFSADPKVTESFAPVEGQPVFFRVPRTAAQFQRESGTGDWYARQRIVPHVIEFLGADGQWHSLR